MSQNIIKDKSFAFAIRIVNLCKYLNSEKKEDVLSEQILLSGTAIGAFVRQAEYAERTTDFISKMSIALKEANKTEYWILLLYETDYLEKKAFLSLSQDITEILKLLTSIINTTKNNINN